MASIVVIGAVIGVRAANEHVYAQSVLWTGLVLGSFVGWGAILNEWVAPDTRLDWGLRAGWGMSLSVLLGGFLCLAHMVGRVTLVTQVAIGLVGLAWEWLAHSGRPPSATRLRRRAVVALDRFGVLALAVVLYAIVVLFVLGAFGDHEFQPSDDPPLYMMMPKKLVETSSMFEPFAARRIPILGGHVYLHALFVAVGSPYYLHVVDGGLCVAIVAGLLVGQVKASGFKNWHIVPLAFVFFGLFGLRNVRVNTGSIYSGLVPIIALYRTVRVSLGARASGGDASGSRAGIVSKLTIEPRLWPMEDTRLVLLAGLAVVTVLMRSSLAGAAFPFTGLILVVDFVRGTPWPWKKPALLSFLRAVGIVGAVVLVGILPWSIMLHESCGTYFYPLGHDNMTPPLSYLTHGMDAIDLLSHFVSNMFFGKPIAALLPFLVAGLVPLAGRTSRQRYDLIVFTLAMTLCLLSISHSSFNPWDIARYDFAAVSAAALVAAASVPRSGPLVTLVGLALAVHLASSLGELSGVLTGKIGQARQAYFETDHDRAGWDKQTREYLEVQSHVPAGAAMATVVRESFRFDFRRNPIYALDALGAMGPKPGWPAHKGAEALAEYLKNNGVDYVVRVDFNEPGELYNRDHWKKNRAEVGTALHEWAEFHLDAEDALDGLSKVRKDVFAAHGMTVIDLSAGGPSVP